MIKTDWKFPWFEIILIIISTIISYYIYVLVTPFLNTYNIPAYIVSIPSIAAIYWILFSIYNNFIWKINPFLNTPNLNWEWKGILKSSYDDYQSDIDATLNIKQTATSIKIAWKFWESKSISLNEGFYFSDIDQLDALFYFYKNEPNYNATATMSIHEWSTKLVYNNDTKKLEWYYYSWRDRNNYWTISLDKAS